MSYPQPDGALYVRTGYSAFALSTLLSSPGDIYESSVSGHALAVGPDSDIANVNFAYWDEQIANTHMGFRSISPRRAYVLRNDAQNTRQYGPLETPGRILFWVNDLYDPAFRPRAFNAITDRITFVAPRLDVIQYFTPIPSLGPARVDKEFTYQAYDINQGSLYIVVPYYGRKYCYVQFTNRNPTEPNTFGIIGVNYAITQNIPPPGGNPYHQETVIRAAAAVASQASVTVRISASATGMFDALVFSVSEAGPAPLRIIMSDSEQ